MLRVHEISRVATDWPINQEIQKTAALSICHPARELRLAGEEIGGELRAGMREYVARFGVTEER